MNWGNHFLKWVENIQSERMKNLLISKGLEVMIPFNRGLRIRIIHRSLDRVVIEGPDTNKRKNHLGRAHAAYLVLLGEIPAGLILAQRYQPATHRLILSHLEMKFVRQGEGPLSAEVLWTKAKCTEVEDAIQCELTTEIKNLDGQLIAEAWTKWQVKEWLRVQKK